MPHIVKTYKKRASTRDSIVEESRYSVEARIIVRSFALCNYHAHCRTNLTVSAPGPLTVPLDVVEYSALRTYS